ncbi:MAG: hypothetical protein V4527_00630 [Pseudomonadota bacterium]
MGNPESPTMEAEQFLSLDGSMTSQDGQLLYLQARRPDGEEAWLSFPHSQVTNICQTVAMQMGRGRDPDGNAVKDAFIASGFKLGRGPAGELVLTMRVGETGELSFLLTAEFAEQLAKSLIRK